MTDEVLYSAKHWAKKAQRAAETLNLNAIFPVGSLYFGLMDTCPLAILLQGSVWEKIEGKYLLASGTLSGTSENYTAGNSVGAGLPNITGNINGITTHGLTCDGAFTAGTSTATNVSGSGATWVEQTAELDASDSSSIYNASTTVRPPAFIVNVWKRTA